MTTVWNTYDKSSNTALSNGDKTAASTTGAGNVGVRGDNPRYTGKTYTEFANISFGGFGGGFIGFANRAYNLTGGDDTSRTLGIRQYGQVIPNAGSAPNLGAPDGKVVRIAIDHDALTFWVALDGGDWNGNSSHDPATGVGGLPFNMTGGNVLYPGVWFQFEPCNADVYTDPADWTYSAPSGFDAWDSVVEETKLDAADKVAEITLSNSDMTASCASGGNNGVRATTHKTTGLHYFEVQSVSHPGASIGLGIGSLADPVNSNNVPAFRLGATGFVNTPSGSGYSTTIDAEAQDVGFAIDLTNDRAFIYDGTDWWGNAGAGADPTVPSEGYPLSSRAAHQYIQLWLQFSPCSATIATRSADFTYSPPSGYDPWDDVGGGGVDGDADGDTVSVTASLIAGTAAPLTEVDGVTITATASLLAGEADVVFAVDGSRILEFTAQEVPTGNYISSDFSSIFSVGDRIANGLITAGQYGWQSVVSPAEQMFDNDFGAAAGNGFSYGAGAPQGAGAAAWFTCQRAVNLTALKTQGAEQITGPFDPYVLCFGFDVGVIWPFSFMVGADQFAFAQTSTETNRPGLYSAIISFTPSNTMAWAHYEILFAEERNTAGRRFTNEMQLGIAHSNLDGGNRLPSNGDPTKRVTISLGPTWTSGHTTDPTSWKDPATCLIDGVNFFSNAGTPVPDYQVARIGKGTGGGTAQDAAGSYIQFVFPRVVIMEKILFQLTSGQETYDSGDNPQAMGLWHWEISNNGGSTWFQVGGSWSFQDNCDYAHAPKDDWFDLQENDPTVGEGATHWRMVLETGPAFGGGFAINQVMFQLIDEGNKGIPLYATITDGDEDGFNFPFLTVDNPSPYVIDFRDGADDQLSGTLTIIHNPLLTGQFSDGASDALAGRGSFYPSMVTQMTLVATGR